MPNITVKDADGTTDVEFVLVTPSAGDKSPAVWLTDSTTLPRNFGNELRIASAPNKGNTVRWVTLNYNYRVVQQVNGVDTVTDVIPVSMSFPSLGTVPHSHLEKAVARACNIIGHADVRAQFLSGYADRN